MKHNVFVVKLPKSADARQYCPKIMLVPGIPTNSSPATCHNPIVEFENFWHTDKEIPRILLISLICSEQFSVMPSKRQAIDADMDHG